MSIVSTLHQDSRCSGKGPSQVHDLTVPSLVEFYIFMLRAKLHRSGNSYSPISSILNEIQLKDASILEFELEKLFFPDFTKKCALNTFLFVGDFRYWGQKDSGPRVVGHWHGGPGSERKIGLRAAREQWGDPSGQGVVEAPFPLAASSPSCSFLPKAAPGRESRGLVVPWTETPGTGRTSAVQASSHRLCLEGPDSTRASGAPVHAGACLGREQGQSTAVECSPLGGLSDIIEQRPALVPCGHKKKKQQPVLGLLCQKGALFGAELVRPGPDARSRGDP